MIGSIACDTKQFREEWGTIIRPVERRHSSCVGADARHFKAQALTTGTLVESGRSMGTIYHFQSRVQLCGSGMFLGEAAKRDQTLIAPIFLDDGGAGRGCNSPDEL